VQSNHEGVLIDAIHAARTDCAGIAINPGGLTHTSVALRDALSAVALPVAEIHVSNVHGREEFRHHSYVSGIADVIVIGAGIHGYPFAIAQLVRIAEARSEYRASGICPSTSSGVRAQGQAVASPPVRARRS
jgi:3-dehydroquinate dehydratase-2